MEVEQARELIAAERARVQDLLERTDSAARAYREAVAEPGDFTDAAQGLLAEELDDAVAKGLQERLAALDRAERRLADGTYGRSVLSGQPIPDERLEADPAAELTVEEARKASASA